VSAPHGFSERSLHGGVDEVPLPAGRGRLWLCGKHYIGPDPEAALRRVAATTVVCLNEAHELEARYPDYVSWLRTNDGERAVWLPVPDLHAPDLGRAVELLEHLHGRLDRGEALLVHCGAGIGRAGTLAVGLLVWAGMPVDAALDHVRASRPMAGPEAGAQRELVALLADLVARRA
jgi:protein-tyrosine phosphatase